MTQIAQRLNTVRLVVRSGFGLLLAIFGPVLGASPQQSTDPDALQQRPANDAKRRAGQLLARFARRPRARGSS
jgi:hypothetical protein